MRENEWVKWLADKPIGFWLTFAGAVLYVAGQDAERAPWRSRVMKVSTAALLGVGMHEYLARALSTDPTLTMAAIIVFGQIVMDIVSAVLRDKDEVLDLVKSLWGRK